ncbi:MAG: hypothetical protein ACRDKH_05785 [Solirubrobacterales bacterium]
MKRLLPICLIALAGSLLVACGDDDDDEGTTAPAISIETPTGETATAPSTPTTPSNEATETAPSGEATETAPSGGEGSAGKAPKGKGKGGGERADLPKCSDIGEGPAPCRRPDGSVRIPEPL